MKQEFIFFFFLYKLNSFVQLAFSCISVPFWMQNQLLLGNILQVLVEDRIISSPMPIVTMSSSSFRWKKYERDCPDKNRNKSCLGFGTRGSAKKSREGSFRLPPKIFIFQSADKGGRCIVTFRGMYMHSTENMLLHFCTYAAVFPDYQEWPVLLWESVGGSLFYFFKEKKANQCKDHSPVLQNRFWNAEMPLVSNIIKVIIRTRQMGRPSVTFFLSKCVLLNTAMDKICRQLGK